MVRQKENTGRLLRILIVEDDEMQARLLERRLREYLEERGHAVELSIARTRAEAIASLRNGPLDAAIVDIGLPARGVLNEYEQGMAVIRAMLHRNMPIIVVTAIQLAGFQRLVEQHTINPKKLASVPVFPKPFFPDDVCHAMLKVIGERGGERKESVRERRRTHHMGT